MSDCRSREKSASPKWEQNLEGQCFSGFYSRGRRRFRSSEAPLVERITSRVKHRWGAELSICMLVAFANICTANNTIAILSVGDISRRISERFGIDPRRSASLLDTTSCCVQGLLPYGAQLLMASGLAGISAMSIVPYLYYPALLGIAVLATIFILHKRNYSKQ